MENTPDDKVYIEIIADFNDKKQSVKLRMLKNILQKWRKSPFNN